MKSPEDHEFAHRSGLNGTNIFTDISFSSKFFVSDFVIFLR